MWATVAVGADVARERSLYDGKMRKLGTAVRERVSRPANCEPAGKGSHASLGEHTARGHEAATVSRLGCSGR